MVSPPVQITDDEVVALAAIQRATNLPALVSVNTEDEAALAAALSRGIRSFAVRGFTQEGAAFDELEPLADYVSGFAVLALVRLTEDLLVDLTGNRAAIVRGESGALLNVLVDNTGIHAATPTSVSEASTALGAALAELDPSIRFGLFSYSAEAELRSLEVIEADRIVFIEVTALQAGQGLQHLRSGQNAQAQRTAGEWSDLLTARLAV